MTLAVEGVHLTPLEAETLAKLHKRAAIVRDRRTESMVVSLRRKLEPIGVKIETTEFGYRLPPADKAQLSAALVG